jgi:hypothetical protein
MIADPRVSKTADSLDRFFRPSAAYCTVTVIVVILAVVPLAAVKVTV